MNKELLNKLESHFSSKDMQLSKFYVADENNVCRVFRFDSNNTNPQLIQEFNSEYEIIEFLRESEQTENELTKQNILTQCDVYLVGNEFNLLNMDNKIQEITGSKDSIFDSSYEIDRTENTKIYYINADDYITVDFDIITDYGQGDFKDIAIVKSIV